MQNVSMVLPQVGSCELPQKEPRLIFETLSIITLDAVEKEECGRGTENIISISHGLMHCSVVFVMLSSNPAALTKRAGLGMHIHTPVSRLVIKVIAKAC